MNYSVDNEMSNLNFLKDLQSKYLLFSLVIVPRAHLIHVRRLTEHTVIQNERALPITRFLRRASIVKNVTIGKFKCKK